MLNPKVSVIIPVYNEERYLEECLNSLLAQTMYAFEIICVDDGSTDTSYDILNRYAMKDARIKIIRQENKFAGVARNNGMEAANGNYLLFLDADDFFDPDLIKLTYNKAQEGDYDIIVFDAWHVSGETSKKSVNPWLLRSNLLPYNEVVSCKSIPETIFQFTIDCVWNKLFKREFVIRNKIRFQEYQRSNDLYFANIALAKAKNIGILDEKLLYYRISNPSSLQGSYSKTPLLFCEALLEVKKQLIKEEIFEIVEKSYVNLCLSRCINKLNNMNTVESFITLYHYLKDKAFDDFGISGKGRTYFYSEWEYEKYIQIQLNSPEEHLFIEGKKQVCGTVKFLFPFHKIAKKSNIILYGAGDVGRQFYKQIVYTNYCDIVLWVDRNYEKCQHEGLNVYGIDSMIENSYDFIVVAVQSESVYREVRQELIQRGVVSHKVIWSQPMIL